VAVRQGLGVNLVQVLLEQLPDLVTGKELGEVEVLRPLATLVRAAELLSSVTWKLARVVPSRRLKVSTLGFCVLSTLQCGVALVVAPFRHILTLVVQIHHSAPTISS